MRLTVDGDGQGRLIFLPPLQQHHSLAAYQWQTQSELSLISCRLHCQALAARRYFNDGTQSRQSVRFLTEWKLCHVCNV